MRTRHPLSALLAGAFFYALLLAAVVAAARGIVMVLEATG